MSRQHVLIKETGFLKEKISTVADPGEVPAPPPPIFLSQTEVRRAEKKILRPGPPLS